MRPVNKGEAPNRYSDYKNARVDLIKRIGEYCSYCERFIPANLAVEHVKPKVPHLYLEKEWENFLLACTNCNSTKYNEDVNLNDYFWPHMDNTLIPFIYESTGLISVNQHLSEQQKIMANNTLKLTGLNKKTQDNDKTVSNRLWKHRIEMWNNATTQLQRFQRTTLENREDMIDCILDNAIGKGFFSIWITVFKDYPEIIEKLIEKFVGTAITISNMQNSRTDYRNLIVT